MTIPIWQLSALAPRPSLLPGGWQNGTLRGVTAARRLRPIRTGRVGLTVEFAGLAHAQAIVADWADLCARALEPNVFLDPAFALPAAQHFPEARRPLFVFVRDEADAGQHLLGLWMIEARPSALAPGIVSGWRNDHAVLGVPLIDRARAADVADALLDAVAARWGTGTVLVIPHVPRAGPTFGLLLSRALATQRAWAPLSARTRAILPALPAAASAPEVLLPARRRKELARQHRRLAERGTLALRSATQGDALRTAVESFLALEGSGWKGRRATALLSDPGSSTFLRAMTRLMAHEGKCRIDSLELDGQPIAMAIVLAAQGRAYFWKTAYDEAYRASSPGVQLALELTRIQLADPAVALTDSCAIADHPMIDRLWRARQDIVDFAIAVVPGPEPAVARILRRERWRRGLREALKRLRARTLHRLAALAGLRRLVATPTFDR